MRVRFEVRRFNRFGAINIKPLLRTDTDGHTGKSGEHIISSVQYVHLADELKIRSITTR